MGNIGFPELMVIFVVALLVFGPKRLPELGKSLGKGIAEFRKASTDLKTSIEREIESAGTESSIAPKPTQPGDNTAANATKS
jgi:sec-independent protein translocase protein TatA